MPETKDKDGNVIDAQFESFEDGKKKQLPPPGEMDINMSDPDLMRKLQELSDIMSWVNGGVDKLTDSIETVIANLTKKLSTLTSYSITMNLQRTQKLLQFIKSVEDDLFSPERAQFLDAKEKTYYYMLAKNALNEVLDVSRKYMLQNKENLPDYKADDAAKRVLDQLKSLPPEKMEALLDLLEKGELDLGGKK